MRSLLRAAAAATAAEQVAEAERVAQPAEDVLEADKRRRIETTGALPAEARMAEAIVGGALLRVRQHGVRFGGLLELLLGLLAALVAIGMVLEAQACDRPTSGRSSDAPRSTPSTS